MIARIQRLVLLVEFAAALLLAVLFSVKFGAVLSIPLAAICGVVVVLLVHPAIICMHFAVSRYAASPTPLEFRLKPFGLLKTIDAEIDASVRGFCWDQPFHAGRAAPVPAQRRFETPILFIHGYFCNRAIFLPMMREAARRGFVCESVTLEPPFTSIDHYADQIEAAVGALLETAQASSLVVVGHSRGGLAARAWMRRFGDNRVRRLVTLGTPHAGTFHAKLFGGRSVAEMRQGSTWLSELSAAEPGDRRAKTTCIFSYHDNIVAPQESARLEGATNIALGGIGHLSLLYDAIAMASCLDAITDSGAAVPLADAAIPPPV